MATNVLNDDIEEYRKRLAVVNEEIASRKAKAEVLRKRAKELEAELKKLGVDDPDDCEKVLKGLDAKIEEASKRIDEELKRAELELGI